MSKTVDGTSVSAAWADASICLPDEQERGARDLVRDRELQTASSRREFHVVRLTET
jgi:hypothetical protein